jgi:hypothetical protein
MKYEIANLGACALHVRALPASCVMEYGEQTELTPGYVAVQRVPLALCART